MSSAPKRFTTNQAILAIIVAVFALALGDALIKNSANALPVWQMLILRSIITIPVFWWLARRNGGARLRISGWIVLRSALLASMWLSYYVSLPLMPLSIAAATYYTAPLIIVALAALVAGKWPNSLTILAVAVGFLGVILVIQPDVSDFKIVTLLPLLAAFLYATAMIVTSEKCLDDDPLVLGMFLNIALIATGIGIALFAGNPDSYIFGPWQKVDIWLTGTVIVLALLIVIGSVGAAIAYQNGPPATIAAFDYCYLMFNIFWGAVFFAEYPGLVAWIGMALIVGAGLLAHPRKPQPVESGR